MIPTYGDLAQRVILSGSAVKSRHGSSYELTGLGVWAKPGEIPNRPGLNTAIGFMEGLQLIGGVFDHSGFARVAPRSRLDLFTENGAYGPRVRAQYPALVRGLMADPESRQHMLYVGRPGDQYMVDTPCTNSMQFLVREESLDMLVSMRSWDVIKGLPYDIMMFGMLQLALAGTMLLKPGTLRVTGGSVHVYTADLKKKPAGDEPAIRFAIPQMPGGDPETRWIEYQHWARKLVKDGLWTSGTPDRIFIGEVA